MNSQHLAKFSKILQDYQRQPNQAYLTSTCPKGPSKLSLSRMQSSSSRKFQISGHLAKFAHRVVIFFASFSRCDTRYGLALSRRSQINWIFENRSTGSKVIRYWATPRLLPHSRHPGLVYAIRSRCPYEGSNLGQSRKRLFLQKLDFIYKYSFYNASPIFDIIYNNFEYS